MTCGIRFLARLSSLVVGAALVLYASPAPLVAQGQATTGIIRGVVTDPNGAPVANASVILHEAQTNFTRTLTTDAAGNFTGTLLPLGTYDVTARSVGYAEVKRTGIALGVGETVALRLPLAAVTLAAVTVEATRPVVDVTKAESSTPLAADVVSGLPNNGRNYLNLTLLTPNVAIVQGPDGDELTVAGQRGIHNNVAVDGADFNNPFFGEQRGGQRPAFTFNLDAVQELVVVAGGANAEFGRSSGGFVNVITKSGTNELHGSVHYFGKFDAVSGTPEHTLPTGVTQKFEPDFSQNHVVRAEKWHLRRRRLGRQRERPGKRPVPRRKREPRVLPVVPDVERVPVPVLARGPASALQRTDQPRIECAVQGHGHGFRQRFPAGDAVFPPDQGP